jgi:glycosyltransferase involved in cell wall biosynthesis
MIMHILHVDHSPVLGGAERSVLELARAQLALGHDVSVAVGRQGTFSVALSAAGIRWRDLGWSERFVETNQLAPFRVLAAGIPDVARAAALLRRLVRLLRPDVVQAHTRKSQLVATLALAGVHVPLVWHLRDDLPARPPLRRIVSLALGRADHAVALSPWLAQSYAQRGAIPGSGHIGLVPSAIDPEPLAGLPTPWLCEERRPVVGYVGQIARWKAPHLLIDAAEQLRNMPVSFRIIGGVWFPAEKAYGRWLRERLERSSARQVVEWRSTTERSEEAFAQIDVLAHTSVAPEPFGRVLVEAMVARRPIVALDRGSAAELLGDDVAVFAARADGKAIADAIATLIHDRQDARRRAERAVARSARYTPAAVAALMDAEYAVLGR